MAVNALNHRIFILALAALAMVCVGSAFPTSAAAQSLYVVKGNRGVVTFTSRRPQGNSSYRVFTASRGPSFSRYYSIRRKWTGKPVTSDFDKLIAETAASYQLDPALVKAVVHVESYFDPKATSPKGAMGLMQLMPGTAQRFGVSKPYQPEDNVRGGVTYLKMLHDRYSGNLRLALAAYNAGEGRVDKILEVPPITETQDYVRKVMRMKEVYSCALAGGKSC